MKLAPYTLFSVETYRERLERARIALQQHSLDAAICVAPENQYYLCGFDSWTAANSPQALVFTRGSDEPTLILRDVDITLATESACISDIRSYRLHSENFAWRIRDILAEKGVKGGRLGVESQSYAIVDALGQSLREALGDYELTDATNVLGALRLVKSTDEIALIERAGRFANRGLEAMAASLVPGVTELELAGEIERAVRSAGSEYWAIPVELTSGDRSAGCHGTPRRREIQSGDLVHAEFAGVSERYHATAIQTICCGSAGAREQELYNIALESLDAGVAAIAPGVSVADVESASLEPLVRHGLEDAAMMRFGYGIGIAYPPIWLETLQISRDFNTLLEPGMVFVLHSCLELPDEKLGVIQGGTYVLEESGIRMLAGAGSLALAEVG